ncbi:hypothetical protein Cci01nite_83240 [Catellatospora citrea]|uniref:Uncharacterized protein n=2 Tax=Catellatospora citrea TaxID=53366 RepID=A0A8J3KU52_9ACTN|nr:hypothetical protein Cci01nite_83240 [Catellatospora citrea]
MPSADAMQVERGWLVYADLVRAEAAYRRALEDLTLAADKHTEYGWGPGCAALDRARRLRADLPAVAAPAEAPRKMGLADGGRQAGRKPAARGTGLASDADGNPSTSKAVPKPKVVKKTTAKAKAAGGRTYRRIPDDFDNVLRQTGDSATAVADHYQVPKHTAYGWIRSARKRAATPA